MSLRTLALSLLLTLFLAGSSTAQVAFKGPLTAPGQVTINVAPAGGGGGGTGPIPIALGWYDVPNTKLSTLCPSYPEIQGTGGCAAVVSAWGAMDLDAARNALEVTGGGHGDYYGNEIYKVDFSSNPVAISLWRDATHSPNLGSISCNETYTDGSRGARHGFGANDFFPLLDKTMWFGGGKPGCGFLSNFQWYVNPNTIAWEQVTPPGTSPNPAGSGGSGVGAYNAGDDNFYWNDAATGEFWQWNYRTNVWTLEKASGVLCLGTSLNAVVDVSRQDYYCAGQGTFVKIHLTAPWTQTNLSSASGCSSAISQSGGGPGIEYNPISTKLIFYIGGNNVIQYDPGANSCSTTTLSGGPPNYAVNNAIKKWRWNGAYGVFMSFNRMTDDIYTLRLDDLATAAQADWNARAAASGVIVARQLSTAADIVHNTYAFAATDGTTFPTLDCTIYTSGGCSVLFTVPAAAGANSAGSASYPFSASGTEVGQVKFVEGQTFYVQMRVRFDSAYLTNQWKTGDGSTTSWKITDFHWGDFPTKNFSSCGQVELTSGNYQNLGFPIIYTGCGATGLYRDLGTGDFLLEQGQSSTTTGSNTNNGYNLGYNCFYSTRNTTKTTCMNFQPNQWYTFYWKVQIGTWGAANSTVQAWISWNGMPYREWVNYPNLTLNTDSPTINGYNYLSIFPYMTGRDSGHPVASVSHVWYNEIIVSTNPIAFPVTPAAAQ